MKTLLPLALAAVVVAGCSKSPDYKPAIRSAIIALAKVMVVDTNVVVLANSSGTESMLASQTNSADIDGPRTMQNLVNAMRGIDVTQCPEDFRLAWIDLVHNIENCKGGANLLRAMASGAAGVVAYKSGSVQAGDLAAKEFEKITTGQDIKSALDRLETVSMKYGVQPSLVGKEILQK